MAKKQLEKPREVGIAKTEVKGKTGITLKKEEGEDIARKREQAKRMAQEKARARTLARQQQLAERIATATEQLAAGIDQASSSALELESAVNQIATGANEAAAACDESRAAIAQIEKAAEIADSRAKESLGQINAARSLIEVAGEGIEVLIQGIIQSAETNLESGRLVKELEEQSLEIGNIVEAVVRIADQTNLLALNAAIEAARAGVHGRGFAVVADEVRNLAEVSERSARDIRGLVGEIQSNVQVVVKDVEAVAQAAQEEVEKAKIVTGNLEKINKEMLAMLSSAEEVAFSAKETNDMAQEFLAQAEEVAAAAEEQSAACEEVLQSLTEMNKGFSEINTAADELAQMAEDLKVSTDTKKSSEELAAFAEELASNIEEANAATQQISKAIEQISQAAQLQAEKTEKSNTLAERLLKNAVKSQENARVSVEKIGAVQKLLDENKQRVEELVAGVSRAAEASMVSTRNIRTLEETTRKIDKIVDAIVNVTIQTNMLAVNGSIEAARAGEYGRGFSVVAGDIRTLANESAENADKIKDLVRSLQSQIQKVSEDIEFSARMASQEVEKAKKTTESLQKVEEAMAEVLKGSEEILQGVEETLVALEQARKGVEQIAAAAQQATKATQEALVAVQEQVKGVQELSEAVEEIASLADELQAM